jgi:hypothetical protein
MTRIAMLALFAISGIRTELFLDVLEERPMEAEGKSSRYILCWEYSFFLACFSLIEGRLSSFNKFRSDFCIQAGYVNGGTAPVPPPPAPVPPPPAPAPPAPVPAPPVPSSSTSTQVVNRGNNGSPADVYPLGLCEGKFETCV